MDGEPWLIQLTDDLERLPDLAEEVEHFGAAHHLSAETTHALNLTLDELVSNTIHHGFQNTPEPKIEIRLECDAQTQTVQAVLRDNGAKFNPLEHPEPDTSAPLHERPVGGLGIHFVRQLMDEVGYERREGWNCITLRRKLRGTEGVSPRRQDS